MSIDTSIKQPTARELIARGIELDQFERPFPDGASPEAERFAAAEEANRRRNQERAVLGYKELYARGVRTLEDPTPVTTPAKSARPVAAAHRADWREEARLASEAELDRRVARLWPGSQG